MGVHAAACRAAGADLLRRVVSVTSVHACLARYRDQQPRATTPVSRRNGTHGQHSGRAHSPTPFGAEHQGNLGNRQLQLVRSYSMVLAAEILAHTPHKVQKVGAVTFPLDCAAGRGQPMSGLHSHCPAAGTTQLGYIPDGYTCARQGQS